MDVRKFPSEKDLIGALRAGNPKAYENIYRATFPLVLSFVYLNNGREDDAQDLVQEAVIVLFRNLQKPDFTISCKVTTYIFSVCRNQWLNVLRAKGPGKDIIETEPFVLISDEEAEEEKNLIYKKLKEALVQLDEQCQRILIHYYYYRQSLDDIAQFIMLPNANAVKVKKFRCIQKLKDVFKKIS